MNNDTTKTEVEQELQPKEIFYDYKDEQGKLLFQVVRVQFSTDKHIYQRHFNQKGEWVNNLRGVRRVIYRLPEVLEAVKNGTTVFVVEGEKDVETLFEWGLVATTNPMGAGKWQDEYSRYLCGADVVIIPDNDDPGRKHAEKVARSLYGIARSVKIIKLPVWREHEDVTDWKERYGGTKELLMEIVNGTPEYVPSKPKQVMPKIPDEIPEGERNNTLASLAGRLRIRGLGEEEILQHLLTENRLRCKPPLPEEEVRTIAKSISRYEVLPPLPHPKKEAEQAEELAKIWQGKYKYATHVGKWMKWTGKNWESVIDQQVIKEASQTLRQHYASMVLNEVNEERTRMLAALIEISCKYNSVKNILAFLQGTKGFCITPEEWDRDPWLLNVNNGTIDLRTGQIHPHNPEDLCTQLAPVDYDPTAVGDAWERHIRYFLPNDNIRRQVQRDLGMALVGTPLKESLPIWYGQGANGKSTTARVIQYVLGTYVGRAAPNLLIQRRHEHHPTELADLKGKRIVFSVEIGNGDRLDEAKVKDITGGDRIKARYMRQDFFEFDQTWTIFLLCNHKPIITGVDKGIWRRIKLIPWTVSIPENQQKPQDMIISELLKESPAILRWLLEGLADWQRDNYWTAEEVLWATQEYRGEQDRLAGFLSDCCELKQYASVSVAELYDAYCEWCKETDEEPLTKKTFGTYLKDRGYTQTRAPHTRERRWLNIKLKTETTLGTNGDRSSVLPYMKNENSVYTENVSPYGPKEICDKGDVTENPVTTDVPVCLAEKVEVKDLPAVVRETQVVKKECPAEKPTLPASGKEIREKNIVAASTRPLSDIERCIAGRETAIDLETTGLRPWEDTICVLSVACGDDYWIVQFPSEDLLKTVVDKAGLLIGHNLKLDLAFMRYVLQERFAPKVFDTMLAAQLIEGNHMIKNFYSLQGVAKRYLNTEIDKEEQTSNWHQLLTQKQIDYCINDVKIPLQLYSLQRELLEKNKLQRAAGLEFNCIPAVVEMELNGVAFDRERALRVLSETDFPKDFGFNPNSPQQILDYFKQQGIHLSSTSRSALKELNHPMAQKLLDYRKITKGLEYLKKWIELCDGGRLYPSFHQLGAATGRFSCSSPNLQNVPKGSEFRNLFIAPEGHVLVDCDLSGIELRIMAWLSRDPTMVNAFNENLDLHRITAAAVSGKTVEEIAKPERQMAKAINFGLIYGMGAETFQLYAKDNYGTEFTLEEAERARNIFFQTYPKILDYHTRIKRLEPGLWHLPEGEKPMIIVRCASGRARVFDPKEFAFTRAVNHPDQGTGADMIKEALTRLYRDTNYKIILTVHDEIMLEVPEDEAETAKEVLRNIMIAAGSKFISPIVVDAEANVGKTWADCH